jgi:hypothetical protein
MKEENLTWFVEALRDQLAGLTKKGRKRQIAELSDIMQQIIFTLNTLEREPAGTVRSDLDEERTIVFFQA